jgi:hypothetical protein
MGDKLVLGILHGAFDWNSHACSSLVLGNPKQGCLARKKLRA